MILHLHLPGTIILPYSRRYHPPYSRHYRTSICTVLSHLYTPAIAPTNPPPPRKGCDPPFLTQLLQFQPLTIVYVSCNVHTQARDVGWFIDHSSQTKEEKRGEYILESLRGFDLFPQVCPFFLSSFPSFLPLFLSWCRMDILFFLPTRRPG
jgi:hypothetical protein